MVLTTRNNYNVLQLMSYPNLYKTDTSTRQTLWPDPASFHLIQVLLYFPKSSKLHKCCSIFYWLQWCSELVDSYLSSWDICNFCEAVSVVLLALLGRAPSQSHSFTMLPWFTQEVAQWANFEWDLLRNYSSCSAERLLSTQTNSRKYPDANISWFTVLLHGSHNHFKFQFFMG